MTHEPNMMTTTATTTTLQARVLQARAAGERLQEKGSCSTQPGDAAAAAAEGGGAEHNGCGGAQLILPYTKEPPHTLIVYLLPIDKLHRLQMGVDIAFVPLLLLGIL